MICKECAYAADSQRRGHIFNAQAIHWSCEGCDCQHHPVPHDMSSCLCDQVLIGDDEPRTRKRKARNAGRK